MISKVSRNALLTTSAGIIIATTATAARRSQHEPSKATTRCTAHSVDVRPFSPSQSSRPPQLPTCGRVETASSNAFSIATTTH